MFVLQTFCLLNPEPIVTNYIVNVLLSYLLQSNPWFSQLPRNSNIKSHRSLQFLSIGYILYLSQLKLVFLKGPKLT